MSTSTVLESDEILLRPSTKEDRQDFTNLVTLPAFAKLSPFGPLEPKAANLLLDSIIANYPKNTYGFWTVIDKKLNAYAGFVGYQPVTFENKPEEMFFLGFNRKFWGSNRPLLAAQLARQYIFKHEKFSRMISFIHPEDVENLYIAQTIGSQFEKQCLFFDATVLLFFMLPT